MPSFLKTNCRCHRSHWIIRAGKINLPLQTIIPPITVIVKMFLTTDDSQFIPTDLVIHIFYGEKTCFCWNDNKLMIFPYTRTDKMSVRVLTAPGSIKKIQFYAGWIFLVCSPQGIYKISRNHEFPVLSKNAIGIGCSLFETITPRDACLCLENKKSMSSKVLVKLSSNADDLAALNDFCTYPLCSDTMDKELLATMNGPVTTTRNISIIAEHNRIFQLAEESLQIIYNSIYPIRDIIHIQKDSKTWGLMFLTAQDIIIIMYSKDNKLTFEQVNFGIVIRAICAGISNQSKDTLWIVCSDHYKLYYAKKQLCSESVLKLVVQNTSFAALQCYDQKTILGLTGNKQLLEFSVETVEKTLSIENDTVINLHPNMLVGTELIMDQIYKRTQELQSLNKQLLIEQNILQGISFHTHKQTFRMNPEISVVSILNQRFIRVNLSELLPKNSCIILSALLQNKIYFCVKKIDNNDALVDLHINENDRPDSFKISISLVSILNEGNPWCLIRNYVKDPSRDKNRRKRSKLDRSNFINNKIAKLKSFITDGNMDMKKLYDIKNSIRREICST